MNRIEMQAIRYALSIAERGYGESDADILKRPTAEAYITGYLAAKHEWESLKNCAGFTNQK